MTAAKAAKGELYEAVYYLLGYGYNDHPFEELVHQPEYIRRSGYC
jgi:hypothetical protein